jgi:hypothetical protein
MAVVVPHHAVSDHGRYLLPGPPITPGPIPTPQNPSEPLGTPQNPSGTARKSGGIPGTMLKPLAR